jgi:hypothetical protein
VHAYLSCEWCDNACFGGRDLCVRTSRDNSDGLGAWEKMGDGMKHEQRDDAARRRPIHHSPLFWIGVVLCLAAIVIYVMSYDLSWPVAR